MWNKVQSLIALRCKKYTKKLEHKDVTVIARNDGELALIDVLHCGYCGRKMTRGTKYNYWTLKKTEENRASKIPAYKCQNVWEGVPHEKMKVIYADTVEPIVFRELAEYIGRLQENEDVFEQIMDNQNKAKKQQEKLLSQEKQKLDIIKRNIDMYEDKIPEAMAGSFELSFEYLVSLIEKQKENEQKQMEVIEQMERELRNMTISIDDWEALRSKIPTWQQIFLNADTPTKRVLVNKLIERIDITDEKIAIRFKINLDEFLNQPRMTNNESVPQPGLRLYHHILYGLRPQVDLREKYF